MADSGLFHPGVGNHRGEFRFTRGETWVHLQRPRESLHGLGFEPWRVALHTHDRVDYTPELERCFFVDQTVGERCVSAWNHEG